MAQKGRPPTGQVRRFPRVDGQTTFSLRVNACGARHNVPLGNERDGWSEVRADIELANVLAQITAGIWVPPPKRGVTPDQLPTFHEYASMRLKRRVNEGIKENTRKDYLWRLSSHLLPFFGHHRIDEIATSLVEQYRDMELEERARIVTALENDVQLRGANGRVLRPLSNTSINKFLILLTRILETAVKRGWIDANPAARVERLKVRRSKGAIL
jgi:Phage integrase SAM-like domain